MVDKRAFCFAFRDKSTLHEELLKKIGLQSLRDQQLTKILATDFKLLVTNVGPDGLVTY